MLDSTVILQASKDTDWDRFLSGHPAGHYTQSSMWGRLKARFGWQVIRILIKDADHIVGGAQILTRHLPIWGHIGYISKGPVVHPDHPQAIQIILNEISTLARRETIFLVSIQPPDDTTTYLDTLVNNCYEVSSYYVVPPCTVVIDLTQSEDELLSHMKRTTRQNIRAAQARGVTIMEGGADDLPAFCQLKQITESRSEFVHYDQCYYEEAWHQFAPGGNMKLWLAYFEEELLAGLMAIYFGQWVVYAWAGSTRLYPEKRPNDLLFWHAMHWGKEQGYHYCDLGGISPIVADALLQDREPPDCKEKGIARYKLGFGPMHAFPPAYDNIFLLKPKWLVRKAIAFVWGKDRKFVSRLVRGVKS
jgi:lipid II:glycine glycyltransferase (peptidoglycan interpeptide bridge formation enzyme)